MSFDFSGFAAIQDVARESAMAADVEAARARSSAFLARRDSDRLSNDELAKRLDQIERIAFESRHDRWVNYATGLGTAEDKTRAAQFEFPWRLTDQEITGLVSGNPIAAKIVEKRAYEMFRRGYALETIRSGGADRKGGASKGASGGGGDKAQIEDTLAYGKKLKLDTRMRENKQYGRQYGGSLLLLGIDDGRTPDQPVDEQNIKTIRFINQIDRRFAYAESFYSDFANDQKFGEVKTYLIASGVATSSVRSESGESFAIRKRSPAQIQRANRGQASILSVHESRVVRAGGVSTDAITRQMLAGWDWSVLQRVYEVLRLCDGSFEALAYLISDASQGVLKLKGMHAAVAAGQENKIEERVAMMDRMRSVMRSIALDTEGGEDFTRVASQLAGVADIVDRIMQYTASAADMPCTELFGMSPAGMNATGESDRTHWYDSIQNEQANDAGPDLTRVYRYIALAHDSPFKGRDVEFKIDWHPLYAPTDKEVAETLYLRAQTDALNVENEIVTSQQAALRWTDTYPSIDAEEIQEEIDDKTKFDPFENDEHASVEAQAEKETDQAAQKNAALVAAAKAKGPTPGAGGAATPKGESGAVPTQAPEDQPANLPTPAGEKPTGATGSVGAGPKVTAKKTAKKTPKAKPKD